MAGGSTIHNVAPVASSPWAPSRGYLTAASGIRASRPVTRSTVPPPPPLVEDPFITTLKVFLWTGLAGGALFILYHLASMDWAATWRTAGGF